MRIINGKVFDEKGNFARKDLYTSGEMISDLSKPEDEVIDAEGMYVIPGLIDIHLHGCMGADFCDGSKEALDTITKYQLSHGITSICPTSMSYDEEKLSKIFKTTSEYENPNGARIVGINMEGPFISLEKKGAQNERFIQKPDEKMFERLQVRANGLIKLLDLAPETEGAIRFIESLHGKVKVSIAHTCADYDTSIKAFKAGADHVTHIFNAMPPMHHRNPGVIGAAADTDNVYVEIIADGIHVAPTMVRTAFKMFGSDRMILISDTMEAAGMPEGKYELGGQKVYVKNEKATLIDGTLAGSVCNLMNILRNSVNNINLSLADAVKAATVNPAKSIGIYDKVGSLTMGKRADIIILDNRLNIRHIIYGGKILR